MDWNATFVEKIDLALIKIEAQHIIADLGKAGASDEAHIARADHGDLQCKAPFVADRCVARAALTALTRNLPYAAAGTFPSPHMPGIANRIGAP